MARTFIKTSGSFATIPTTALQALLSGKAAVSVHAWLNLTSTTTGANDNRLFNTFVNLGTSGMILNVDNTGGGTSRKVRLAGRSIVTDALQARAGTSDITLNVWTPIGGVFDYAADTITPYFNGTAEGGGAVTFGASAYTPGVSPNQFAVSGDGSAGTAALVAAGMGEIAWWSGDIGAVAFAHLAAGAPANSIPGLLAYWITNGDDSPELDSSGNGNNMSIGPGLLPKFSSPPPVHRSPSTLQVVGL